MTSNQFAFCSVLVSLLLPLSPLGGAQLNYPLASGGATQDAIVDFTPVATVFNFVVPQSYNISDARLRFAATHEFVTDISVKLESPSGTSVTLINVVGTPMGLAQDTYFADLLFDDAAIGIIGPTGQDTGPWLGTLRPQNALSAFDGENANGTWKLIVEDYRTEKIGYVYAAGENTNSVPYAISRFGIAQGTELIFDTNGPVIESKPIELWRMTHFGSPDDSGLGANGADPDKDGSPNLMEYALGRNPHSGNGLDGNAGLPESSGGILMDLPSPSPIDVLYEVRGGSQLNTSLWSVRATRSGNGAWNASGGGSVNAGAVVSGRQLVDVSSGDSFMHLRVQEIP